MAHGRALQCRFSEHKVIGTVHMSSKGVNLATPTLGLWASGIYDATLTTSFISSDLLPQATGTGLADVSTRVHDGTRNECSSESAMFTPNIKRRDDDTTKELVFPGAPCFWG